MKRLVSIVRKLFVFLVLHVETAFTPKNTLMFASVLATPNGQCFLNLNHPDKSKIGKEVEIINLHHSNFNPQKGYVDEWLYNVWDGAKSLGWAPECDLVINKPS